MDAKPMTPAEIAARLRNRSVGGYLSSINAAAADFIDAQAAEIAVYKTEQEELFASMKGVRAANKSLAAEITALRAERDRAMEACEKICAAWKKTEAERDALAARLAVPGEEEMDELVRCLSRVGIFEPLGTDGVQAARALTALRARVAGLEGDFAEAVAEVDLRGVVITRLVELLKILRQYVPDDVEEKPEELKIVARVEEIEAEIAPFFAALSPSAQEARDAE